MKTKKLAPKTRPRDKKNRTAKDGGKQDSSFPIVGIGASAGGLEAFEQFFSKMPEGIGMAFILVPHLDPSHASMMSELLRRVTKLEVKEAEDGMKVLPNHIYVIPPNKEMSIFHGVLNLEPLKRVQGVRLPIDSFFRSLAEDQGERAVGIVLSGTGSDGTIGLRAIHAAGGVVMVQAPDSAKYPGMPRSAVQTGLADVISLPDRIPLELLSFSRQSGKRMRLPATKEDRLRKILALVRSHTGRDFSLYKKTTLSRRVDKRMNLHNLGSTTDYIGYLQENPGEITLLFKDMLIGVTQFFRDPEAFEALKKTILKYLQEDPETAGFRAWVPACGTGEEAFSIAIILMECLEELEKDLKVQVFATDINEEAINTARNGVFSDNIAADVGAARLRRWFKKDEGGLRVKKEIRESIVFAAQDITKDPPFTKLDLLSCRNLLIYLEAELQNRVLPLFHYSLKPGGLLFLGNSESIGKYAELFSATDKKWKIFQTKKVSAPLHEEDRKILPWIGGPPALEVEPGLPQTKESDLTSVVEKTLLETFSPPLVVVNGEGEILYVHGQTGKYLEPPPGPPNWNVFEMAHKGIRFEMRSGVHYALTRMKERSYRKLRVKTGHGYQFVDLTIKPFSPAKDSKLVIITFEDVAVREKRETDRKSARAKEKDGRLQEAERELRYTRETLQATVEELQASNEEFKSTNEEMQSSNEELQSTNEELETSREELQSTNEELTTVNSELQGKIEQFSQTENDMKILLESTQIGTVFLDKDLRIERFTSRVTKILNLIPGDVGRPIHDIRSNLEHDDVAAYARNALATLQNSEKEVQTKDGPWYLMQVVLSRSGSDGIKGLVLTFTEITGVRQAREFAEGIVETVREPLIVLDGELRVVSANRSFYRTFAASKEKTEGRLIYELGDGQWDIPELRKLLGEILPQGNQIEDYPVEHEFPRIGRKRMLLNAREIVGDGSARGPLILLAMEDITARGPMGEKT